jgi:hypothetical protein
MRNTNPPHDFYDDVDKPEAPDTILEIIEEMKRLTDEIKEDHENQTLDEQLKSKLDELVVIHKRMFETMIDDKNYRELFI